MKDLFTWVMEADGDEVEAFDPGPLDNPAPPDQPEEAPAGDEDLVGAPPTSDEMDTMSMDDDETMTNGDTGDEESSDDQKDDTSASEKAGNILNQRLYQQMINRNNDIESIIKNLDKLQSVIPYDVNNVIRPYITDLKQALFAGQSYVVNDFGDTEYGENIMYYNKLNALYTTLLNSIDVKLKKVETDED